MLTRLELRDADLVLLVASLPARGGALRSLDLSRNGLRDATAIASHFGGGGAPELVSLKLGHNPLSAGGFPPPYPSLVARLTPVRPIYAATLKSLGCALPSMRALQTLSLSHGDLGDEGAQALFGSLASEGALSASGSLFSGHRHCHQPPLARQARGGTAHS